MTTQKQDRRAAELYEEIYKNVTMGAESITDLLPHVRGGALKNELGASHAGYEKLADEARRALVDMGVKPREQGAFTRLSAKAGVMMNTMVDDTSSHIAQMMIEGATMGTTDLLRKMHEFKCETSEPCHALNLAERTLQFEEDCIEKMKAFL